MIYKKTLGLLVLEEKENAVCTCAAVVQHAHCPVPSWGELWVVGPYRWVKLNQFIIQLPSTQPTLSQ